jgi:PKD repeat protein
MGQRATKIGLLFFSIFSIVLIALTDTGQAAPVASGPQRVSGEPIPLLDATQDVPQTGNLSPAATAVAQNYVITVKSSADTYLDQAYPNNNYGGLDALKVSGASGAWASSLFRFNLAGLLPPTARVISATLSVRAVDLRETDGAEADPLWVQALAVTSDWNEYTVTFNTAPNSSPRGDGPAWVDASDWQQVPVTEIVRDWVAGVVSNHGIGLIPYLGIGQRHFRSRESPFDPYLTVVFAVRQEFQANKDTYVDKEAPSTNFGGSTELKVIAGSPTAEAYTLVEFDLSGIPADTDVISATLLLYSELNRGGTPASTEETAPPSLGDRGPAGGAALYVDAIVSGSDWTEMGVAWNGRPGSVYLNDPSSPDFVTNGWTALNVTNIVRQWLDEGLDNDGFLVRSEASTVIHYYFTSREGLAAPRLIIDYGPEIPPPCTPVTGAAIDGITVGQTGIPYHFSAAIYPAGAGPVTGRSWTADGQMGTVTGDEVDYAWHLPGEKQITHTIDHCGGTTYAHHTVTIQEPPAGCDVGIDRVSVTGPLVVATGVSNLFQANGGPMGATTPITFSWIATEQTPTTVAGSSLSSSRTFAWAVAGTKTIQVTAENCGGAAVATKPVEVIAPALLPDLAVTSAWYDKTAHEAYAVIENVGQTTAPANHWIDLIVGGVVEQHLPFEDRLEPGSIAIQTIPYTLACSGQAAVQVVADATGLIAEMQEANNAWQDTWQCDQLPPDITSGPTVSDISETGATIQFETNEACASWVRYSHLSYVTPERTDGPAGATVHAIRLAGLANKATYHFQAFCADPDLNTVNSADLTFQTLPPGSDPPTILDAWIHSYDYPYYEYYGLYAELRNDDAAAWTDRVEFYLDNDLVGTRYNSYLPAGKFNPSYWVFISPFHLGYSREDFFAQHQLTVRAYASVSGNYSSLTRYIQPPAAYRPIDMWVFDPNDNHTIYVSGDSVPIGTQLAVTVRAAQQEWGCTWTYYSEGNVVPPGMEAVHCAGLEEPADQVMVYLDGVLAANVSDPPANEVTLSAHIGGLDIGNHALEVRAYASDNTMKAVQRTLIVEKGTRDLAVARKVTRVGHYLEIALTVSNIGTLPATVHRVDDFIVGLQQVDQNTSSLAVSGELSGWYDQPNGVRKNWVKITPKTGGVAGRILNPGQSTTVSYIAVPVLYQTARLPRIGEDEVVTVHTWDNGWSYHEFYVPATGIYEPDGSQHSIQDGWVSAVFRADYIIVTNPRRIYDHYGGVGVKWKVENLFSRMAELATLQQGVLGFVNDYDHFVVDNLVEPGGYWRNMLNPIFRTKDMGYMLLVGETEIIPAKHAGHGEFATTLTADHVEHSDLAYADTTGETARPELVVGRVIGDHIDRLRAYLGNVIKVYRGDPGHEFNRQRAMLVSGRGEGTTSNFVPNVNEVASTLSYDGWDVSKIHWLDYGDYDSYAEQGLVFTQTLPNQDVVFYRDHGNQDSWHAIGTGHVPEFDFGDVHPFAFGVACLSGNYERGDDSNLAEEFLYRGAGLFVGATQVSHRGTNDEAAKRFFNNWDPDETIGQIINSTKRHVWGQDLGFDHGKMWAYEYNIYGCPKYGRMEEPGGRAPDPDWNPASVVSRQPEATTIRVTLPAYEVTTIEGLDRIILADGGRLLDPGYPEVPLWVATSRFSAGIRVQDVRLTSRRVGAVQTGLLLGYHQPKNDCQGCPQIDPVDPVWWDGWWPALEPEYDWWAEENHDGSTTLFIRILPFHVFSDTYTTLYHNGFTFEVDTIKTGVSIGYWRAEESNVAQDDGTTLALALTNTGSPLDVVVQTTLRNAADKVVGGLPLETLERLSGSATVSLTLDTHGYPVGDYKVVVELLDTGGRLLDSAGTDISLGIYAAEVTALSAAPDLLEPGTPVTLSLTIANRGSVPLTGTAVLLIQPLEGLTTTARITVPFANLGTGRPVILTAGWDSTGAEPGAYRVLGYAQYMGMTTQPITTPVTLYQTPVVAFYLSPRSGVAPLRVTFENLTTGTYDACLWDWGDGGSSNQCFSPVYTYTVPGTYSVTLAVTGPGGTVSDALHRAVTVYQPVAADFAADVTTGRAPLTVWFTFQATGDYDTCTWSFGDGGTGNKCLDVSHIYERAGSFDVSLTVSGNGGQDTESKRGYIVVTGTYFVYLPVVMR